MATSPKIVSCTLTTGASAECAEFIVKYKPDTLETVTDLGTVAKVGLALDGVPIFADAPSVLDTGHLPALDPCGGHIDPGGWYHWHTTSTDIESVYEHAHINVNCEISQSSSALFGYAFDGFAMYGSRDMDGTVPNDLDNCGGHFGATQHTADGEYHYHSTSTFPNLPQCLSGISAENNFSTTAVAGIGAQRQPRGAGRNPKPDFSAIAKELAVSEQTLIEAIQKAGGPGPRADKQQLADLLGVSAEALNNAFPPRPPQP